MEKVLFSSDEQERLVITRDDLKQRLAEVYKEAADLIKAKQSYDVEVDARVLGEYVRAYEFIQELDDKVKTHD